MILGVAGQGRGNFTCFGEEEPPTLPIILGFVPGRRERVKDRVPVLIDWGPYVTGSVITAVLKVRYFLEVGKVLKSPGLTIAAVTAY